MKSKGLEQGKEALVATNAGLGFAEKWIPRSLWSSSSFPGGSDGASVRVWKKGNTLALLVEIRLIQPLWKTVWRFL